MEWLYESDRICKREENGRTIVEACYDIMENGDINVTHVFVEPKYRGQKMAEKVMEAVRDYLRKNDKKLVGTCPYAKKWIRENTDNIQDILSKEHRD